MSKIRVGRLALVGIGIVCLFVAASFLIYTGPKVSADINDSGMGRVLIDNYRQGESVVYQLRIVNDWCYEVELSIRCRLPDNTVEGYERPDRGFLSWVGVDPSILVLDKGEVGIISVNLTIPEDVDISLDKWEFWVGITDTNSKIRFEKNSRWLVDMR